MPDATWTLPVTETLQEDCVWKRGVACEDEVAADGQLTGGQKTVGADLDRGVADAERSRHARQDVTAEPDVAGGLGGRASVSVQAEEHDFTAAGLDEVAAFGAGNNASEDHTAGAAAAAGIEGARRAHAIRRHVHVAGEDGLAAAEGGIPIRGETDGVGDEVAGVGRDRSAVHHEGARPERTAVAQLESTALIKPDLARKVLTRHGSDRSVETDRRATVGTETADAPTDFDRGVARQDVLEDGPA